MRHLTVNQASCNLYILGYSPRSQVRFRVCNYEVASSALLIFVSLVLVFLISILLF